MRPPRKEQLVKLVGALTFVLLVGTLALLSKPEWREYFVEVGSVLGVVFSLHVVIVAIRGRFHTKRFSPFERALRRESSMQKPSSQLLMAISMTAAPEKSTFDLLAATTEQRLQDSHGIGLDDDRAREVLGSDVFELLTKQRGSGPTWALRNRSARWRLRFKSLKSLTSWDVRRHWYGSRSAINSRNATNAARSKALDEVRTILTRLEQL